MATAPGANMLSTSFWLIIVLPVRVKTYRSLKIKFFVKVKISPCYDWSRLWLCTNSNYGPAPDDFKVKILWCVMEFCIEQYYRWWTTYLQTISYTSYEILTSGFLLMQYFVWSRLWHFGVTFGSRLWHFWYRSRANSCTDRKTAQFLFGKYFSSTK